MNDKSFLDSITFRLALVSFILGFCIFCIIYFKDLLKPFAMALIVWYFIKAIYNYIGRIRFIGNRLPRWLRGTLSLVIIFICAEFTIEIIITNLSKMISDYSKYKGIFDQFLIDLGGALGVENVTERLQEAINQLDLRGFLESTLSSLSAMIGNMLIVIIYTVFLLLEEVAFSKKMNIIFHNSGKRDRIQKIFDEIYGTTNKYITLKTYVSLLTAGLSYLALLIFGVEYAFLWAFLIFLFNYIPYIGSLLASLLPSFFAVLQFGSLWPFIWIFIVVGVIQIIVGNYVEPKIMGRLLNLSPLVVVVALSFWGFVWGVLGMFLSVPITSVMLIIMAQFPITRNFAIMLTENGNIENILIRQEQPKVS